MIGVSFVRPGLAGAVLLAVLAGAFGPSATSAADACPGSKVKFYRDPMGGPDTSPVPKKDSMNMDYIAVCESEAGDSPGTVRINPDKVQRLGVRSAVVGERDLSRTIRAFASLQFDERRQYVVAPKFSGWIEKLHVNATGDAVERGQILFEVFSPELNVLQQEWGLAGRSVYASDKLRYLDYPEAAIDRLRRGERPRTVAIPTPVSGTVVDKTAVEGARFRAGETLFRIVDVSTMWVMAEVYEQDLGFVKAGDSARISVNAWPDRPLEGKVTLIYPSVGRDSRTARLRIEVPNPDGRLRADMAAIVEITTPVEGSRVAVPDSALIDTGRRKVVLVERGEGRYEPRKVTVGARMPGWVQINAGLQPGEKVVTQATFLIDAESNIRAALAAFGAGDGT
ncbi:efflux RND transporter periplasmic adaptor subunit [Reyranella sp.]|uniref:efflux RND transporter periplasmic adaptor subunit n=1 Tax=Reyranella sp. TaxID=1929291 RepID=UPI003D13CD28